MALVYRLICRPTGLQYIGYTSRPLRVRWNRHKAAAKLSKENGRLQNAIRAYGPAAFDVHVVADGLSEVAALQLEATLIREWDTLSPAGLNLTTGGDRVEFTEEVRQKLRSSAGHLTSPERREQSRLAKNANRLANSEQLTTLLNEGVPHREIAESLGVSGATVSRWASRLGVFRPQDRVRTRLLPEALRLRDLGLSQQKIADQLGVSQMAISKWLRHAADE